MNRRISMVLAAIAASAVATPALANDPGKMFMINAVTPGVVSFSGEGTAQFNNASTTANAFSVGSSSNFGVNASASSTLDYMVDANALLQLAGTSQLQQTIGTSSSAANTQAASQAAMEAATNVAEQEVNETLGETWSDYVALNGGNDAEIAAASGGGSPSTVANGTFSGAITTETAFNAERNKQINELTKSTFASTVESANSSSSSGQNADGVISGSFDSSSYSRSDIGATASAVQSYVETARAEADNKFGSEYASNADGTGYMDKFNSFDITGSGGSPDGQLDANEQASAAAAGLNFDINAQGMAVAVDETSWTSTRNEAIESTVSDMTNQASSNGQSESENSADVTVTGIGSIATLNASDDSAFNVDVATRIRTQLMTTNGTANGSAGGNLATSSFANQSLSQSASAFIQAFGADTVTLGRDASTGELTGATVSGRLNVDIGVVDSGVTTTDDNLTVTVPAE